MSSFRLNLRKSPAILLAPTEVQPTNRIRPSFNQLHRRNQSGIFRLLILHALLVGTLGLWTDRFAAAQSMSQWNATLPFWQSGSSWTPIGVPGTNDIALFDINTTDTVTWNAATGNRTTGRLEVVAGNYTFNNVTATPLQLNLTSPSFAPLRAVGTNTTLNINGLHINATAANVLIDNAATVNLGVGSGPGVSQVGRITSSSFLRNNGTLNISSGSIVSNTTGSLGSAPLSSGTTTVSGIGSTWNSSLFLRVGENGSGTLNVLGGGVVNTGSPGLNDIFDTIGMAPGSTGTATVSGAGSRWASSTILDVGDFGSGILNVENGGVIDAAEFAIANRPGSEGTTTVTGTGSQLNCEADFSVGLAGTGTMFVENGGVVCNDACVLGSLEQSSGTVTIQDIGSTWMSNFLCVGDRGDGDLTVQSGGMASSITGFLGTESGSFGMATVTGSGSQWNCSADLVVGRSGAAVLSVTDGGFVSSRSGFIGRNFGGVAIASIAGDGSQWLLEQSLSIGGDAATGMNGSLGRLNIFPGSSVIVGNATVLFPDGLLSQSFGTFISESISFMGGGVCNLNGGTFTAESISFVGGGSLSLNGSTFTSDSITFNGGGTCNLNGGVFTADSISLNGGGSFNLNAGTMHIGSFTGNLINEGVSLAPGQSAGSTTIFGNYSHEEDAILEIEIGGTVVNSEFDFVNVTGNVFLNGELNLVLINGFTPTPAQTFTILNAGNIFGFFNNASDNERVDIVGGEGSFLVRYGVTSPNPTQIILSEFEPSFILGDINNDGVVSLLDVAAFVTVLTSGVFDPAADINQDGIVSLLDVGPFVTLLTG